MNKKKIFGSITVLAIATMATFNMNINVNEKGLSELSLNNVEALANENGNGSGEIQCWNNIEGLGGDMQTHKTYCGECKPRLCSKWSNESRCKQ